MKAADIIIVAAAMIKVALGFIGLTDIEVITVEGVAFGADATTKALNAAMERATVPRAPRSDDDLLELSEVFCGNA